MPAERHRVFILDWCPRSRYGACRDARMNTLRSLFLFYLFALMTDKLVP